MDNKAYTRSRMELKRNSKKAIEVYLNSKLQRDLFEKINYQRFNLLKFNI